MEKIFFIAGEPSGDLHASNLVKEMKLINPSLQIQGWGGELMSDQGVVLKNHLKNLSFMGFLEVFLNLRKILNNFKLCKNQLLEFQPDVIIMVDYPGFNLRMAKWAKKKGFKIVYYISPQIWAWKESRVKSIKANIDRMYCILPFEEDFYAKHNYKARYLGHPLMDEIAHFEADRNKTVFKKNKPIISILPGSREQEIDRKLGLMLSAVSKYTDFDIYVACAPNLDMKFFAEYKDQYSNVYFVSGKTYKLLLESDFAIVTSGTATLETALFKVPQVVCYKSSNISYFIARMVVDINFISLVNLILNREVVRELIQNDVNILNIQKELDLLINDSNYRSEMLNGYDELIKKIGKEGCSKKIAQDLLEHY